MKMLFIAALVLITTVYVQAGITDCTATPIQSDGESVQFTIDKKFNTQTLIFTQRVAWEPEALIFNVIYSGQVEDTYIVVASSPAVRQTQLIEIRFEAPRGRINQAKAIMRAGDRKLDGSGRMAKSRDYNVSCT